MGYLDLTSVATMTRKRRTNDTMTTINGDRVESLLSPTENTAFTVWIRNDFRLQECQGPYLKQSFPDLDYALLGYNILLGYPLAVGHDPGFTLPIFAADYSAGHMTADCRYSVPKGIVLIPDVSCITSFSSDVVESTFELAQSLSASAHASGGGWGVSFSASAGYKESSSELGSGQSVYIISRASCNYYYMRLLERDAPPFHHVFLNWIVDLNRTDDDDVYMEFFENYGTHFLTEVKFGASFTYEHKMTTSAYKKETSEGVDVAVAASYSGLFSVGGGFNMDSSQREAASSFQKKVTTRTITIGAAPPANGDAMTWASTVKESPVPVSYDLRSIEDLFSERFMTADYMQPYALDYQKIQKKIKQTKQKYCARLRDQGLVDNCGALSPGLEMKKSRLYTHFAYTEASTKGQCVEECLKRTSCVAIAFCQGSKCEDYNKEVCYMYKEGMEIEGTDDDNWTTVIILSEIEDLLKCGDLTSDKLTKETPDLPLRRAAPDYRHRKPGTDVSDNDDARAAPDYRHRKPGTDVSDNDDARAAPDYRHRKPGTDVSDNDDARAAPDYRHRKPGTDGYEMTIVSKNAKGRT
nr:hypothetical protein BaRGS_033461 [Batillaria attramentaria]